MYVPIIYYHSVAPEKNPNWIKRYLTLELDYFEDQIKFFSKNNFESIFLEEYFELRSIKSKNSKKYICITFDDGFLDNWIYVFPILQKYNLKATIFINPEFVDIKNGLRKTLKHVWEKTASIEELNRWGYLSWDEMRAMEASGLINIQSHTLTHTKYFVSDKIIDFHHPGSQYLNPIGNMFPQKKPYYIEDKGFEKLMPYGSPFFEEASSMIARKVLINPEFISGTLELLKNIDFEQQYDFNNIFQLIKPFYLEYKKHNNIILSQESNKEYTDRITYELKASKEIIEKELGKIVDYVCWPNHDYNDEAHQKAKEIGYKASVIDIKKGDKCPYDRFDRISISSMRRNKPISVVKAKLKLRGFQSRFPYSYLYKLKLQYD